MLNSINSLQLATPIRRIGTQCSWQRHRDSTVKLCYMLAVLHLPKVVKVVNFEIAAHLPPINSEEAKMLYYLIKFIKLCINSPFEILTHYGNLKREWTNDRIGKCINEAAFISYEYFSNCFLLHKSVEKCEKSSCIWSQLRRIIEHLDRAQYSIDIAIYVMDSLEIGDALRRANKRGVRVRLICYKSFNFLLDKYGDCIWLRRLSPMLRQPREMMMHHKFCVIDGYMATQEKKPKALTVCMTGSMNWIATPRSCDDFLITSSPRIAKRLEKEFVRMWLICGKRENAPHVNHLD